MVGIAQLVSASDCGSEGRGFESLYPPAVFQISDVMSGILLFHGEMCSVK